MCATISSVDFSKLSASRLPDQRAHLSAQERAWHYPAMPGIPEALHIGRCDMWSESPIQRFCGAKPAFRIYAVASTTMRSSMSEPLFAKQMNVLLEGKTAGDQ